MTHFRAWGFLLLLTAAVAGPSWAAPRAAGSDDLTPSLSIALGWQYLFSDDLEETYGFLPSVGVRLALPLSRDVEFFMGALYTAASGNPYDDVPDFSADAEARLVMVPLEFGMRADVIGHPSRKFYLGQVIQFVRVREELPGISGGGEIDTAVFRDWDLRVALIAGPEWRYSEGRRALGLEFSFGVGKAQKGSDGSRWSADLSSLTTQAYFTVSF